MAQSFTDKMHSLVNRLIAATDEERVRWEKTDRPYSYSCSVGGQSVLVSSQDNDGDAPFELAVIGREGDIEEVFVSTEISSLRDGMAQLHARARRNATHVDKAIDDLLTELDPDRPPF